MLSFVSVQNQHHQGAPLPPIYESGQPLATGPYPQAPMPPADDGWGKVGVLMVMLALAFAGGVAYFIATADSSAAETQAATGETAADEAAEGASDADGDEDEKSAGDEEAPGDDSAEDPAGDSAAALTAAAASQSDAGLNATSASAFDGGVEAVAELAPAEGSKPPVGSVGLLRANGEIDRPAGLVSLSIESEPSGAKVIRKRDGVRLGVTPYRYEVESAAGDLAFVLELEGYRSMSVQMPSDRDGVRQVMLLPGKGGVPIPAPAPERTVAAGQPKDKIIADPEPGEATPDKPKPKPVKTASRAQPKPKKPRSPPKPKKPKPKKPSGTVDYTAVPIPLD